MFAATYVGWFLTYPAHLVIGVLIGSSVPLAALVPFLAVGEHQRSIPPAALYLLESLKIVALAWLFLYFHKVLGIRRTWMFAAMFVVTAWSVTMALLVASHVHLGGIHL